MINEKNIFKIDPLDVSEKNEYNLENCLDGILYHVNRKFGTKDYVLECENLVHFCMGVLCGLREGKKKNEKDAAGNYSQSEKD